MGPGSRGVAARGIATYKPPQSEKAMGRDPLSSRDISPFQKTFTVGEVSAGRAGGGVLAGRGVPPPRI